VARPAPVAPFRRRLLDRLRLHLNNGLVATAVAMASSFAFRLEAVRAQTPQQLIRFAYRIVRALQMSLPHLKTSAHEHKLHRLW
jgi:hypothetical protein